MFELVWPISCDEMAHIEIALKCAYMDRFWALLIWFKQNIIETISLIIDTKKYSSICSPIFHNTNSCTVFCCIKTNYQVTRSTPARR